MGSSGLSGPEAAVVDPYDWLGVPKSQRPPTHYQLLGLHPTADEIDVEAAANRQLAKLDAHRAGPYSASADRLTAEINEARDTLSDPERRRLYDILAPDPDAPAPPPPRPVAAFTRDIESPRSPAQPWWTEAEPEQSPLEDGAWWKTAPPPERVAPPPPPPLPPPLSARSSSSTAAVADPPGRPRAVPVPLIAGGLALILIVAAGAAYFLRKPKENPVPDVVAAEPDPPAVPAPKAKPAPEPKPAAKTEAPPAEKLPVPPPPRPANDVKPQPPLLDDPGPRKLRGHTSAVVGIAAGADGCVYSIGDDKVVHVWTGHESTVLHTFRSPGIAVATFDEGRRAAACDGLTVTLFDPQKPNDKKEFESPRGGVRSLAVSADGRTIVTGLSDGFVRAWKAETGTFDEWKATTKAPVQAVRLTSSGQVIAAGADGPVSVWQLAGQKKLFTLAPHKGVTVSLDVTPDGKLLATGGADTTATVYDLTARKEVVRFAGHTGPVTGVAWLPDGKHLATASADGTARLWSVETGRAVRWLHQLDARGECLTVGGDGKFSHVGTAAGAVWRVPLPGRKEVVPAPVVQPPAEPLPVPSALARRLAQERVQAQPLPPGDKAEAYLAGGQAADTPPPIRYVLLTEARRLAVATDDPNLAGRAAVTIGDWFDVDNLRELAVTIGRFAKTNQPATLAEIALEAIERAELAQRPEMVGVFLRHVRSLPNLPPGIARGIAAAASRQEAATAEAVRVKAATATLKANPDEPEANSAYGMYLCAGRQHWDLGLPYLARGADAGLKELARADLKSPPDPAGQLRIAEGWVARAMAAEELRTRRAFLGRARHWFSRAIAAKPDGPDATRAKSRLEAVARLDVAPDDATTPLPLSPTVVRRGYESMEHQVRPREWAVEGDAHAGVDGVRLGNGDPALRSLFDLLPGSRIVFTLAPDGRDLRLICAGQDVTVPVEGKSARVAVSFTGEEVRVQTSADGGAPAERVVPVPPAARGAAPITVRLVGEAKTILGTPISSAVVRGPVRPAVPKPE